MNELQIFKNAKFKEVRMILIDDEPWFVGKDVAENLGYSNTKDALSQHVDIDDKQIIQRSQITTLEIPNRGLTLINESGVYSLILSSKLPQAKDFKKWVTSEILPSIRRTGMYISNISPQAQLMLYHEQQIMRLDKKIDKTKEEITDNLHLSPFEAQTIKNHVNRVIVPALGGKSSPAYQDASIRGKAYSNIYWHISRKFDLFCGGIRFSYLCLKSKDFDKVHEVIENYELPKFLKEEINEINERVTV